MKKRIKKIFIILFWLMAWQIASDLIAESLVIVSPIDTIKRLFELILTQSFRKSVATSFVHIMSGYLSALVVGSVFAVISRAVPIFYDFISPIMTVIKATPVASFTIIVFLWIKAKYLSLFISFIMVLPIIYFGVYEGIGTVDIKLLQMADVFKVPFMRKVKSIYLPAVIPFLVSAASVAVGFAWKSGIAVEVICISNATVGNLLYNAKLLLETDDIFAITVSIIVVSKLTESLTVFILKRIQRRWTNA